MFWFPGFACLLRLYLLNTKFNFETPYYLVMQKRYSEAKIVLKKIYKPKYIDEVLADLKAKKS